MNTQYAIPLPPALPEVEMILVDPRKPETLTMLKQAYHGIYMPAFPNVHERESLQTIADYLETASAGEFQYVVVIAGTDLHDPGRRAIHGLCAGGNFFPEHTGLLAYMAVLPGHRKRGLGKKMTGMLIQAMKDLAELHNQSLKCVMIEVHDPEKVPPENDSMDPGLRLNTYKKWGAKRIPFNYVLPPLEEGQEKCRNLLLLAHPVDGKYPDKKAVLDYVRSVYGICPVPDHENDPDFQTMKEELSKWDGSFDNQR